MKIKAMMLAALAALALSAAFASSASATTVTGIPKQTFHTVQTPTGPMQVPDVLHGEGTADGKRFEWSVSPCVRATPAQYSAYTAEEISADPDRWCFKEPTGGLASSASKKAKKKNGARKAKNNGRAAS